MKDECGGIPIRTFCGLRSKMYSYLKENEIWDCKAKGIKKNVIKKQIRLLQRYTLQTRTKTSHNEHDTK